jgi:integrase/recombinase XerD
MTQKPPTLEATGMGKSGKNAEIAFMPEHIATRLAEYVQNEQLPPDNRVFPLRYTTVRNLVTGLGKKLNVKISPHDLHRHSATYTNRNGIPLEIVSKVILRNQDLKTKSIWARSLTPKRSAGWMACTGEVDVLTVKRRGLRCVSNGFAEFHGFTRG